MQRENLRPQKNIENNDKQTDEGYQKILIDNKEFDERDQISKNDEEKHWSFRNHETVKFEFTEKYIYLGKESDEINPKDMSDNKESDER